MSTIKAINRDGVFTQRTLVSLSGGAEVTDELPTPQPTLQQLRELKLAEIELVNEALARELRWLWNRTPEEIMRTREAVYSLSPDPRPIPEGKTLEDMVCGKWPGDETDDEIREALERLS